MKQKIFTILLAFTTSIGTLFAAGGKCGDNLTWSYATGGILTISGTGAMYDYDRCPWSPYANSISTAIIKNGVTSIGNYAFCECHKLTSITIPNTVTSIGNYAFSRCNALTSIEIPNSVTSIGEYTFYNCYKLTSITIPNTVKSIGNNAFSSCTDLPIIDNLRYADIYLVSAVDLTLSTYTIKDGTKWIGNRAFSNCKVLTSIVVPSSVICIGKEAFCNCISLTSIEIPHSVISIEEQAFSGCTSLTSIEIPNSVNSIGAGAFSNCNSLTAIDVEANNPNYCSIDGVLFNKDTTTLIMYPRSKYGAYTIPNSVTIIGDQAFYYCTNLTSIEIPNSITSIGEEAFSGCKNLTSVTISNSVTSIGDKAFYYCTNLTSIEIPNSVTNIGEEVFSGCSSLTSPVYTSRVFVYMPTSYLGAYVIPEGIESIANYAFRNCTNLTSIEIPNSVKSIGASSFYNCQSLSAVHIFDIATWCKIAFSDDKANPLNNAHKLYLAGEQITNLIIPNSVTSIRKYAFSGCSSLNSVTIPTSVTSIGSCAFQNCSGLISTTIHNGIKSIGDNAFSDCFGLTSINIPSSVTSIGSYAFSGCKGLTSVAIPNSVTSIGSCAFSGCEGLTSVAIPNSVTSIGSYAFSGCKGLTSVAIPNSVTSIEIGTFSGCSGLTSVTIPNSVTIIRAYAFRYCSNLKLIYSKPITPPMLANDSKTNPFNVPSDAIVYVPNGSVSDYRSASFWKEMIIRSAWDSKSDAASTSASITINNIPWELNKDYIASVGIEGGDTFDGNTLEYIGLEPNSEYKDVPVVLTSNTGETETVKVSFTTTALELTTKASVPVSEKVAILLAETNMADIETSCGFEWKRHDAPEDMAPNKVVCPVANGTMAGRLKNLKDDVYYKYRAFYESAAGNMYYGEWQYIFTGDVAVEFDPILYTYAAALIKEREATLKGYALAGSTDFTEQGFEYWAESRAPLSNAPRRQKAALGERHTVTASGISMKTTLSDLDPGTNYRYRTYAKIGDQILYGSEMTFTTQGEFTYAITFTNWNGEELLTLHVAENALPEYTGATPERPEDEEYTYEFSGWSPSVTAATSDVTYTAQFTAIPKSPSAIDQISQEPIVTSQKLLINDHIYILRGDKVYTVTGQLVK